MQKKGGALDKHFNRTTLDNAEKVLEESHHSENDRNVGSQPDDMPYSHSGSLRTGSDIARFEIVESDKEGRW